jgi:hypothetical protein
MHIGRIVLHSYAVRVRDKIKLLGATAATLSATDRESTLVARGVLAVDVGPNKSHEQRPFAVDMQGQAYLGATFTARAQADTKFELLSIHCTRRARLRPAVDVLSSFC